GARDLVDVAHGDEAEEPPRLDDGIGPLIAAEEVVVDEGFYRETGREGTDVDVHHALDRDVAEGFTDEELSIAHHRRVVQEPADEREPEGAEEPRAEEGHLDAERHGEARGDEDRREEAASVGSHARRAREVA